MVLLHQYQPNAHQRILHTVPLQHKTYSVLIPQRPSHPTSACQKPCSSSHSVTLHQHCIHSLLRTQKPRNFAIRDKINLRVFSTWEGRHPTPNTDQILSRKIAEVPWPFINFPIPWWRFRRRTIQSDYTYSLLPLVSQFDIANTASTTSPYTHLPRYDNSSQRRRSVKSADLQSLSGLSHTKASNLEDCQYPVQAGLEGKSLEGVLKVYSN